MEFAAPGVYVLRAKEPSALGQQMVAHWLLHNIQPRCMGCLWLTQSSPNAIRLFLNNILSNHKKGPKGLDILCLTPTTENLQESTQNLCRSLNTLTVLKPALLVLEDAQRWLGQSQSQTKEGQIEHITPLKNMQQLQRWADYANVRVLLPWHGDLPHWCTFATGFAEVNAQGDWVFSPWWPSAQGMQTMLWNESYHASAHHLLSANAFPSLQALGLAIYRMRYFEPNPGRIYIQNNTQLNPLDAIALLRLGADEVINSTKHLPKNTQTSSPIATDMGIALNNPELANAFAKDLHELWMPGRLQCLPIHQFVQNGQMTLQLMQGWGLHNQLIRLSLRKHMHAAMALQLLNAGSAGAMVCATREALYIIKLWAVAPSPSIFQVWLQSCFYEPLETLFSGHVIIDNPTQQEELLLSLNKEFSVEVNTLEPKPDAQGLQLPELWQSQTNSTSLNRPWLDRLQHHFEGNKT